MFLTFDRTHRPLSTHLRQRFFEPLRQQVLQLSYEQVQGDVDDLARQLVDQVQVRPPVLLGQEGANSREGEYRPGEQRGYRIPTVRYYTAVQVEGDVEVLGHWPDEVDATSELHSVDEGLPDWTALLDPVVGEYDYAAQLRRHEALLAQDRWTVAQRWAGGPWALYTFVDLTSEEIEQVEQGLRNPGEEMAAAVEEVRPIVLAIAEQTRRYFDRDLPQQLGELLRRRRRELSGHQAVLDSLTFPVGWTYPEPALEPLPEVAPPPSDPPAEVHLGLPARLADASFADLLRTLRVWANAVEGHPRAYRELPEERVSDLIAATLNAALPGAGREVYNRSGRTDIYVRAEDLSTGAAPARVFICECKWWHGAKAGGEALEQLFGYLDARDTAAVLLFLVKLRDPTKARVEAVPVLQAHSSYVGNDPAPVLGWPVLRFDRDGTTARVCVVFVDLPDLDDTADTGD